MNTSAISAACPVCSSDDQDPVPSRDFQWLKGYPLRRCPVCGLQMLDPQPDDPTLASIYRKEYYDAWGIQQERISPAP